MKDKFLRLVELFFSYFNAILGIQSVSEYKNTLFNLNFEKIAYSIIKTVKCSLIKINLQVSKQNVLQYQQSE